MDEDQVECYQCGSTETVELLAFDELEQSILICAECGAE